MTSAAARLSPQTCFRLPHCFGHFVACSLARPPALRRADYRLPPVIVLPLWMVMLLLMPVVMLDETSRNAGVSVVILVFRVLLHIGN